jgi:hypothetical protein
MLDENTAGGAEKRPEEEKPAESGTPASGSDVTSSGTETPETGSETPETSSDAPEPEASEPPPMPPPGPPPVPPTPAASAPTSGGGAPPSSSAPTAVDNSEVDSRSVLQAFLITTGVFLIGALLIYIVASLPTTPNFRPADFYDTQEWDQAEVLQREQLQEYSVREVEVQVQNDEGETVTEVVEQYTLPIDEAKQLIVERGLPVRGEDGTTTDGDTADAGSDMADMADDAEASDADTGADSSQ